MDKTEMILRLLIIYVRLRGNRTLHNDVKRIFSFEATAAAWNAMINLKRNWKHRSGSFSLNLLGICIGSLRNLILMSCLWAMTLNKILLWLLAFYIKGWHIYSLRHFKRLQGRLQHSANMTEGQTVFTLFNGTRVLFSIPNERNTSEVSKVETSHSFVKALRKRSFMTFWSKICSFPK